MNWRLVTFLGLGISLLLGACSQSTSFSGDRPIGIGECIYVYDAAVRNNSAFQCYQKGLIDEHLLEFHCSNERTPGIYFTTPYPSPSDIEDFEIDFLFHNKNVAINNWSHTLLMLGKGPSMIEAPMTKQFATGLNTSKSLSYELYNVRYEIDLDEYSEEVSKFLTQCKLRSNASLPEGRASNSSINLTNEYLAEARKGLPRYIYPITLEKVTVFGNVITTYISTDKKNVVAGESAKAKKAVADSLKEIFTGICSSRYFQSLVNQGFVFKLHATGINSEGTSFLEAPITEAECRKGGFS